MEPPYRRVAADLRGRIAAGELNPGDRVPSTRQITRDWGVALATATKALQVLTQEGLVHAVPRVGTVVTDPAARPVERAEPEGLTRARVVAAAMEIADTQGLAGLSMRAVAAKLGVAAMAPYRYVDSKEDLILLMMDESMGEAVFPEGAPRSWRAGLELAARQQWRMFRRHPWLAQVFSLTRPQILPKGLRQAEWTMTALAALNLPKDEKFHVYVTMFNYVRGTAVNLEWEREAEEQTGLTDDEWMSQNEGEFVRLLSSGDYPVFAAMVQDFDYDMRLDNLFEFGLLRMLDGLTEYFRQVGAVSPEPGA
ncbi:TetR/AcrR family transcriptional regulator C-terminal domain-containing protein [Actinokineospora auranticolor]|uniref:Regulatory TetR family protein n=1 Tax=Actinokineospora auranticolor TaxID=155976 RepID=A0A2S6GW69_9PSEU|nr:TetR/AcrR family transcriptional regulator C-terminal domain-containing protein [Actinokineospora auranticolor]PPK69438.1 regulatory TetR family protein [Actinokineospora auranticolor]